MRRAAVVQYFTTNEGAQRNRELIEDVLIELVARDPGGVQYQVLMSDDGLGFMHVVAFDGTADPFADCAAYREFHKELAQRLATPPVVTHAVLIGSYHGRPETRHGDEFGPVGASVMPRKGVKVNISHTASREEWLAARMDLLAKEKAASRQLAALAEQRRALPAVAIDKDYVFEGPDGKVTLIDLFEGRSQLIVYHFMWLHDIDDGCPSCSFAVDDMPDPIHLNEGADTTLALVSRVPYARLSQFKARMGWRLPWYSSHGSDFNYDFHVSNDESIAPVEYNYKDKATLVREGLEYVATDGADGQGISVFVQAEGKVFHTYSAYGVGADVMLSTYRFLDLTPLGRQRYINEWPWHDTYGTPNRHEHHH